VISARGPERILRRLRETLNHPGIDCLLKDDKIGRRSHDAFCKCGFPAATAEASRHGWHHTGDVGYLDEDNYLYIVDRLKDMIISGGFNVYSAEVEQALLAHPAVLDCAVVGLPDDKWGERVTAVLQLHSGHEVTAEEIKAFVKARVGSVKTPKQVEVWDDLPRSRVGKVLKTEVKSRLQNPLEPH